MMFALNALQAKLTTLWYRLRHQASMSYVTCGTAGSCRHANRSIGGRASAICVTMQSLGAQFCCVACQVTGVAAFPGGATKSFGNDLPKMCGAPPVFMRQQIAHMVVRLAKSAAQATSPGPNARV